MFIIISVQIYIQIWGLTDQENKWLARKSGRKDGV